MGDKETRKWHGSVCAGVLTSRWPFGKMITCSDHIELKSLVGRFVLPQEEVLSVDCAKFFPWLWMRIRIAGFQNGALKNDPAAEAERFAEACFV